jgi:microcystin-dependent protein
MSAPPTVTNAPTPPVTPDDGDLWFNVLTGRTYVWYIGPSGVGTWVETQPTGGALVTERSVPGIVPQPPTATSRDVIRVPEITVSPIPPVNPLVGDLWWSPITGMECIWYDDGNSLQWVQTQPVKYINLATLAGPAGGDLTGMYPNPQIIPGVILDQPQLQDPPDPALNDEHLVSAAWVNDRVTAGISGPAGGDLQGNYPDPTLNPRGTLNLYALINSPAFTGSPTAPTVSPATDSSISIATTQFVQQAIALIPPPPTTLPPSGAAGGGLSGTYPNPAIAAGADGYVLTSFSGVALWTAPGAPPTGIAGGMLSGAYPNPNIRPSVTNGYVMTTVAGVSQWAAPFVPPPATSVGVAPPATPVDGQMWFYTDNSQGGGSLFIRYNDGNSTQWVPAAPAVGSNTVPPGAIMDFAGATAPVGWLLCNGQLVSRAVYPALFTAIGTQYGAGDGSTTFGVPDLRGRVTAGPDPTNVHLGSGVAGAFAANAAVLGAVAGEEAHVISSTELAAHNHAGADHRHNGVDHTHDMGGHTHAPPASPIYANAGNAFGFSVASGTTGSQGYLGWSGGAGGPSPGGTGAADRALTTSYSIDGLTTGVAGSSAGHNTVQPTMIMNKIIKI